MKTTLIAVAGLAAAASGQTVIDLSGINVDGTSPTVFTVTQTDGGPLSSFDFDITVDVGGVGGNASWASEVFIGLSFGAFTFTADGNDIDLTDDGPNDLLFGWGNSGGIFSFQGSVDMTGQGPADTQGDWVVTLIDQFDDFGIDYTFLSGSTITINKVPAPAGLAILGLGGLVVARRRR